MDNSSKLEVQDLWIQIKPCTHCDEERLWDGFPGNTVLHNTRDTSKRKSLKEMAGIAQDANRLYRSLAPVDQVNETGLDEG